MLLEWLDNITYAAGQLVIGGVFLAIIVLLAMKIWSIIPKKAQNRIKYISEILIGIFYIIGGIGAIFGVLYAIFSWVFL